MDNLGEIIILIIFIVLSMIGGLKKDKKKQQQSTGKKNTQFPPKRDETRRSGPYYGENQRGSYGNLTTDSKEEYSDNDYVTWNPEETYDEKSRYSVSSIKSSAPTKATSEQEFYLRKMKELETDKTKTNSLYTISPIEDKIIENKKNIRIKELLKSPRNLKDYILISDILGKPKALRR